MKKVLAICLVMVMLVSMNISVFAAPGSFVSSPSGNPAPILISFECGDEGCTAKMKITPYADRDTLPAVLKTLIESFYAKIAGTQDLTTLNVDLAKLAANKNLTGDRLAVSDLFDIYAYGCEEHEEHKNFTITLDADTLSRFVGLLHMKDNGEIELIKNAKVLNDGEHLQFTAETMSPFAIVVDTGADTPDGPQTGDNNMNHIYLIIMIASALALAVVLVMNKKQRA